jgi:hypothetical protein
LDVGLLAFFDYGFHADVDFAEAGFADVLASDLWEDGGESAFVVVCVVVETFGGLVFDLWVDGHSGFGLSVVDHLAFTDASAEVLIFLFQ